MTHRNHRTVPHPTLSYQRADYQPDCAFDIALPEVTPNADSKAVLLQIRYRLSGPTLLRLIADGQANYASVAECPTTYRRVAYRSRQAEHELRLDPGEWGETLTITPYVAANKPLPGFAPPELTPAAQALLPQGIDLPAGAILAIGAGVRIALHHRADMRSIFDLVPNRRQRVGAYRIDLSGNHIAIALHPDALAQINAARAESRHQPLLQQGIYLQALDKAIRNLGDYPESRWAAVLRQKLTAAIPGCDPSDAADLNENSEYYAQALFEDPLDRMLTALRPGER